MDGSLGMDGAKVARETQVNAAIQDLENVTNKALSLVEALNGRLSAVLCRPNPPATAPEPSHDVDELVPLAGELFAIRNQAAASMDALQDILSRLEI